MTQYNFRINEGTGDISDVLFGFDLLCFIIQSSAEELGFVSQGPSRLQVGSMTFESITPYRFHEKKPAIMFAKSTSSNENSHEEEKTPEILELDPIKKQEVETLNVLESGMEKAKISGKRAEIVIQRISPQNLKTSQQLKSTNVVIKVYLSLL